MNWGKIFSTIYAIIIIYGAGIIVAEIVAFIIELIKERFK